MNLRSPFGWGLLVTVSLATFVTGCQLSGPKKSVRPERTLPLAEVAKLTDGLYWYLDIKGTFPASRDALEEFCLDFDMPCSAVDWSRVSWQSVDDQRLVVVYSAEEYSIPITLERDSDSRDQTDTTRDRLEEDLRKLMGDRQTVN